MAVEVQNSLLSSQKASGSSLRAALHPLVLLTISDYITRHTLRNQKGPLAGALLGQQNGREITIEHAFECHVINVEGETLLHKEWFEERLKNMKDVHKAPALDLVGWYTTLPASGPKPVHLPIHRQILDSYNESAILLGFHPTAELNPSAGGKLPLTIYESNYESEDSHAESGEDKEMTDSEPQLGLKFRELPYSIETGEAEMISVDFVARGGGNATAVAAAPTQQKPDEGKSKGKGKGKAPATTKGKEESAESADNDDQSVLSREDEELIASIQAKANAVKMLQARIDLIAKYLKSLPPSYTDGKPSEKAESNTAEYVPVNHSVLRSIHALLSRLCLLIPADGVAFTQELQSEKNDVNLVSLLNTMTESIKDIKKTGRKFSVIEAGKHGKIKGFDGRGFEISPNVLGVGDLLM